jgi:osmotically-inducible protein OsmY
MKSDSEIKYQVEQALQADRRFDAGDLSVAVKGGVVTLSGRARSQLERYQAEGVARGIWGVVGLLNEVRMKPAGKSELTGHGSAPTAATGRPRR